VAIGEDDRIRRERDLFARLLDLGTQEQAGRLLEEALQVAVEATHARQGYLAVYDDAYHGGVTPRWRVAVACDDEHVGHIERVISHGIIARAMTTGELLQTASAMLDPRFAGRESVKINQIDAVLCMPIGSDGRGVLYLQGRDGGQRIFSQEDEELVRLFGRHLSPLLDRLLEQPEQRGDDPTLPYRREGRFDRFVGQSHALANTLALANDYAPLNVHLLLTGESGTGKSLLAQEIHRCGPRAEGPFVNINCAVIPEQLLETELFGAVPGAHSTALQRMVGKIEAANGGTLFLDEISELPIRAQAKLLQFIQDKVYYPVGSPNCRRADVRILAATNRDLEKAVQDGSFRLDLFHRIAVLQIRLPTLQERRSDVPLLLDALGRLHASELQLPWVGVSPSGRRAAQEYSWPGNIRELSNAVHRGVIQTRGRSPLEALHLLPQQSQGTPTPAASPGEDAIVTWQQANRTFQAGYLRRCLEQMEWNVSRTAVRLDITRSHLYTLIRTLGVERPRKG